MGAGEPAFSLASFGSGTGIEPSLLHCRTCHPADWFALFFKQSPQFEPDFGLRQNVSAGFPRTDALDQARCDEWFQQIHGTLS